MIRVKLCFAKSGTANIGHFRPTTKHVSFRATRREMVNRGPRAVLASVLLDESLSIVRKPVENRGTASATALEVTERQEIHGNVRPDSGAC